MRGRASSSRRQRAGAAVVPNRSGSGRSSTNGSSSNSNGSSSLFHSHSQSVIKSNESGGGGGKPKWLPSWRKLRRCLLQPYSLEHPPSLDPSADPSPPTRQSPSCGSDDDHSAHHDHDDDHSSRHPNNVLSSPVSLASSSSSSSSSCSSPPPPPPPPPLEDNHESRFKNLAHPLAEADEEEGTSDIGLDRDGALRDSAERMEPQRAESGAQLESHEPVAIKAPESSAAPEDADSPAPAEEAIGGSPTTLLSSTECNTTAALAAPATTTSAKPGPVRRTITEAPARSRLSASVPTPNSSLVAPDLKSHSNPKSAAAHDSTNALEEPGPRAAAAPRPTMVRRGCSVPVLGAAPPTATKQPLSPTSARLSLLPPKAPLTSSGGAANRPSIVARRISSTATTGAGPMRPRLGSSGCESNLTSSSRHRRSNNSFEFSVDSLQMIRDGDANDPDDNINDSSTRNLVDPRGRQVSENSWSTMPVMSIQIGTLERDCSEIVSDDFWEVDSLIMSSDGEDEDNDGMTIPEGAGHPANGYDTVDDDDDDEEDSDKDNGVSPSPTSIMDDVESRGKEVQDGAGLPDWMLQWAQQPAPGQQDDGAEDAASAPYLTEEPTYLPSGPKPEGCALATYVDVSMGEGQGDSTLEDGVRLVQVLAGKLVVEGKWELELNRDTRIQPICVEDDPHRVVLVRHDDKEWKLRPVPFIAVRGGGFRRAPIKSRSGGAAVVSSEGWDDATHYDADWSVGPGPAVNDDSQQCVAALHLVFLLDAICRQRQVKGSQ
jgi:hypothetical protein